MKRPLNVDLICKLRVMGHGNETFTFESDEGDGYNFCYNHTQDDPYQPKLKSYHFSEWVEQLGYLIDHLKAKETELKLTEAINSASNKNDEG
jgi:hypothetical protein